MAKLITVSNNSLYVSIKSALYSEASKELRSIGDIVKLEKAGEASREYKCRCRCSTMYLTVRRLLGSVNCGWGFATKVRRS